MKKEKKNELALNDQTPKIIELTEMLQRLQAEFENYRKRSERQHDDFVKFANKQLLIELLPIYDHLGLALNNTENHEEFVKGIEMIFGQLNDFLKHHNVEKIAALDKSFNPEEHEALLQEDCEGKSGIVLEELQPGFKQHGVVIRTTKVKVGK